jgi:hypothetical protein
MGILGIYASQISGHLAPPIIQAYESISTITVGSAVSSVTFSSIPSTYKHLQIRVMGLFSVADRGTTMQFNGDTAANYAWHRLIGNGTAAAADGYSGQNYGLTAPTGAPSTTNNPSPGVIDILDYADTNKFKTVRSLSASDANGNGSIIFQSSLWRSTSAITSIKMETGSGNYNQYSSFALYGIKG